MREVYIPVRGTRGEKVDCFSDFGMLIWAGPGQSLGYKTNKPPFGLVLYLVLIPLASRATVQFLKLITFITFYRFKILFL
jgi:hypothetical protein